MKLSPFKAIGFGAFMAASVILLTAAANKYTGNFRAIMPMTWISDSFGVTNTWTWDDPDNAFNFDGNLRSVFLELTQGLLVDQGATAQVYTTGDLGNTWRWDGRDLFNTTFSGSSAFLQFHDGSPPYMLLTGPLSVQGETNTGNLWFSTNAFPLAAGTVWDWSKYAQFISTNADFNVTAIGGLDPRRENQAQLQISNASASQIICHLTFAMNKLGPLTTNDIYLASHKQAYVNGDARGIGTATNIVTLTEP